MAVDDLVADVLLVAPDQHGPELREVFLERLLVHGLDLVLGPGLVIGPPLLPVGQIRRVTLPVVVGVLAVGGDVSSQQCDVHQAVSVSSPTCPRSSAPPGTAPAPIRVLDDLRCQHARFRQILGLLQGFVLEPEGAQARRANGRWDYLLVSQQTPTIRVWPQRSFPCLIKNLRKHQFHPLKKTEIEWLIQIIPRVFTQATNITCVDLIKAIRNGDTQIYRECQ